MGGSWTPGDVWGSESDMGAVYQKDEGRQGPGEVPVDVLRFTVLYSNVW